MLARVPRRPPAPRAAPPAAAELTGLDGEAQAYFGQDAARRDTLLVLTFKWAYRLLGQPQMERWLMSDPEGALSRSVFITERYQRTGELHPRAWAWLQTLAERDEE